jgi:hypothetical protein
MSIQAPACCVTTWRLGGEHPARQRAPDRHPRPARGEGTTIGVQSKAANGGGDFQVGVKGEIPSKPGQAEWFIFVGLGSSDTRPEFFIVPRNVIAAFAWCSHRAWIKGTSRDGKPHKDNSMRNI